MSEPMLTNWKGYVANVLGWDDTYFESNDDISKEQFRVRRVTRIMKNPNGQIALIKWFAVNEGMCEGGPEKAAEAVGMMSRNVIFVVHPSSDEMQKNAEQLWGSIKTPTPGEVAAVNAGRKGPTPAKGDLRRVIIP